MGQGAIRVTFQFPFAPSSFVDVRKFSRMLLEVNKYRVGEMLIAIRLSISDIINEVEWFLKNTEILKSG